jgi:hypothetical protein
VHFDTAIPPFKCRSAAMNAFSVASLPFPSIIGKLARRMLWSLATYQALGSQRFPLEPEANLTHHGSIARKGKPK